MTTPETRAPVTEAAWTLQQQWDAYYAQDPAYAAYYQQYQYPATQDSAQYREYYQQYPPQTATSSSSDPPPPGAADPAQDAYAQWYQQQGYTAYDYQQYPNSYTQQDQQYSHYPSGTNNYAGSATYNQHQSYYQPAANSTASNASAATAAHPTQWPAQDDISTASAPWRKKAKAQHVNATKATSSNSSPVAARPKMMLMTKKSEQPKPAATAAAPVTASNTPAHATSASTTQTADTSSPTTWPDSLKQYVQDAFDCCMPGKQDAVQAELSELISEASRRGTIETIDWSEMDLPSGCHSAKKRPKSTSNRRNSISTRINRISLTPSNSSTPSRDEMKRREARLKRFQESTKVKRTPTPSPATPATPNPDVMDWDEHTIVGTSTQLEKQYLRLTSAPDPTSVRPLPILRQTLELILKKWQAERNYTYMCDQFKSMRQDLTVQRIQNEFTVQVYETHARIALEMGDLGEYNQCQTQLKDLYSKGIAGNLMEFLAYRILYMLHTQNRSAINAIMAEMKGSKENDAAVRHALQVRSSLATSNYHRFFLLYKETPNMGMYLIHQFIERERIYALRTMCKAYRPHLDVAYVQKELAFDTIDDVLKFFDKIGLQGIVNRQTIDTKIALPGLNESTKKFMKVDINRSAITV